MGPWPLRGESTAPAAAGHRRLTGGQGIVASGTREEFHRPDPTNVAARAALARSRPMTEREWLGGVHAGPMLNFVRGRLSDRKLRLFACACCRRHRAVLRGVGNRRLLEACEDFADGGRPGGPGRRAKSVVRAVRSVGRGVEVAAGLSRGHGPGPGRLVGGLRCGGPHAGGERLAEAGAPRAGGAAPGHRRPGAVPQSNRRAGVAHLDRPRPGGERLRVLAVRGAAGPRRRP